MPLLIALYRSLFTDSTSFSCFSCSWIMIFRRSRANRANNLRFNNITFYKYVKGTYVEITRRKIDINNFYILTRQTGYVVASVSAILLVGVSISAPCRIISVIELGHVDAGLSRDNIGEVEASTRSESFWFRSSI